MKLALRVSVLMGFELTTRKKVPMTLNSEIMQMSILVAGLPICFTLIQS